jgi:hypothetical protein
MATETRCPECGAAIRAGAEWCTQCYADLGADRTASGDTAPAAAAPADEASAGRHARHRAADDAPPPGWPCPTCDTVNDLGSDACRSCGSGFLAPLAADRGLPAVPAFAGLSRGARLGVAVGVVVVVLVLLGGIVWLVS